MLTGEPALRVGIIGAGNISGVHLNALAQLGDNVRVAAICDVDQHKAQDRAEAFGVPTVFPDAESLIASDQVDIVLIATPPDEHSRLTQLALAAGKHVVCEKPMATNVAECDAMITAAEASAGSLFVVQNRLYTAAMRKATDLIAASEIGEVIHVLTEGYEGEELAMRMPSITTDSDGVIRTQMMHQTYVVPGLLGRDIASVNVRSNSRGSVPMAASDVTATAIFTYSDDTIQTSVGTFGLSDGRTEHKLEIHGTKGDLRSTRVGGRDDRREILQHRPRGQQDWADVELDNPAVLGPEFARMWRAYLRSIRTGEDPPTTVAAARHSMVVVDAMYESAANQGQEVSLGQRRANQPDPQARRLGLSPRPRLPVSPTPLIRKHRGGSPSARGSNRHTR